MPLLPDGASPEELPVQIILPGFEDLVADSELPISLSEQENSELDGTKSSDKANQLILPGFEELMLSNND